MLYILHTVCLRCACSNDSDGLYIGFKDQGQNTSYLSISFLMPFLIKVVYSLVTKCQWFDKKKTNVLNFWYDLRDNDQV